MKFRTALVAASLFLLPAAAFAQPVDGLYVGAGVGLNYLQRDKLKIPDDLGSFHTAFGILGLADVGFGFGNGFRVEIQGDFRSTAESGSGSKVRDNTYGGFFNGLYDIDVGAGFVFPYVGVGVGYEEQNMRHGLLADGTTFSGTKGGIAGQGIIGASFPLPDVPGLSVTVEYRIMDSFESHTYDGVKLGPELNHSGVLGLRYAFGIEAPPPMAPAPAPAPVAAPAPAPARTYLVFFDWDKSDLSARAKQIIAEAAQNSSRVKVTRIEVSGYADRTGTATYNLALSQRRADAVAGELVRDGVPKAEIATFAFGDTHLLVPTGPGVREPQNRRVEIVLK